MFLENILTLFACSLIVENNTQPQTFKDELNLGREKKASILRVKSKLIYEEKYLSINMHTMKNSLPQNLDTSYITYEHTTGRQYTLMNNQLLRTVVHSVEEHW